MPKEAAEIAALGEKELGQGVDMVENILSAASFEKGTMAFAHAPFDMAKVVKESVEKMRPDIERKGLSISAQVPAEAIMIVGDEQKMRQNVVRNLIDNSLNYTQKGSITVSLSKTDGKVLFSVKDSGVGITPEDMQKMFTAGGHGTDSQKINVHSTGYGLFNVKQVVEAHGGKVFAESEGAGCGSTFTVELPAVV